MSGFRPELHVAQQSRRDKLRVPQQSSTPSHHLEDFPDNLEQIPVVHSRLNPDLVQVRNVDNANLLYDPAVYSSDMIHFSSKSNVRQEIDATDPFANSSHAHPISSNFNSLSKAPGEPRNWKSHGGSQQGCDWAVNYASGSVGSESNVVPSPVFFGEVNNISGYPHFSKPSHFNEFQDVRSSFKNSSSTQDRQKHFTSSPLYQNSLQDVVTSASNRTQGLEMVSLVQHNLRGTGRAWPEGGNELALLPAYGNQSDVLCFENAGAWPNRPVENWSGGELGFAARKSSDEELRNVVNTDSSPQGLSLSLSSNPTSKLPQFGEGSCGSVPKPSIISKGSGKSIQDIVGVSTTNTYRNTGPLGPFTGYATILKSSKFLRPAQLLLDEFCGIKSGSKLLKPCEVSERMSGEVSTSGDAAMNATESEVGAMGNNSGGSSSTFYSSNEISGDGGVGNSSCESFRPDYQQKKAKLLYMQEEVGCWFIFI